MMARPRSATPYELLTGKPQEKDWMELLFGEIEENFTPIDDLINQSPAQMKACEMQAHKVCDDYAVGKKIA